MKTKVLIVDDSAMVRAYLKRELSSSPDIEVVGVAADPFDAREQIAQLKPDVLTLDIEMPRMDGLTFLHKLMEHHPLPVVIFSSLTTKGSAMALDAMQAGAVEVVCKGSKAYSADGAREELLRAVHAASKAKVRKRQATSSAVSQAQVQSQANTKPALQFTTQKVIAVGASTGGTVAFEQLLRGLPCNMPGLVLTQHMPREFTALYAQRLHQIGILQVRESKGGEMIVPGQVFIAPGGKHLKVMRSGASYFTALDDGPQVHFQKPSCDILFRSVAEHCGKNAVGVLLTGMGADGAQGLLEMRQKGAVTLAQDEKSCVVYGMPRAAAELGAVQQMLPLQSLPEAMVRALQS
jgi:two-component system, chemotaxis family, protein-glutamate methylesterase/glutaminase